MLLINKPSGPTSHDIVDEVRKITGIKKVGHAGTLDPFAEGLLIVLVGREETRRQAEFLNMDKVYEATFVLGEERDTDDVTGSVRDISEKSFSREPESARSSGAPLLRSRRKIPLRGNQAFSSPRASRKENFSEMSRAPEIPIDEIKSALKKFTGEIEQMPPDYSAKKIKGKKAYELAREGKEVVLKPKKVTVYELELLEYKMPADPKPSAKGGPELKIRTKVSSGTYIRSIARDIGRELGVGAYVSELKRTEIGKYSIKDAQTLDELKK